MKEIRSRWDPTRVNRTDHANGGCGPWMPNSRQNRLSLNVLVYAATQVFGPGTHWIDERQAPRRKSALISMPPRLVR